MGKGKDVTIHFLGESSSVEGASKRTTTAVGKVGGSTDKLSGTFLRLHESLGKVGPASASLTTRLDALGLSSGAAQAGFIGMGAAAGVAAVTGAVKLAEASSALNEQVSATRQVFGDASDEVIAYGQTTARTLGLTEKETLQAANVLGTMFKGAGLASSDAAKLDTNLITLSADMAAFADTTPQDALESLQAAFRGEFDPIEKYGVSLSAAKVEQEGVNLGLAKTAAQLTDGQKKLATYSLIMSQTIAIQGQAGREAGSLAGQQARLDAVWGDTAANLGGVVKPAVTGVQGALLGLNDAFHTLGQTSHESNSSTGSSAAVLGSLSHVVADNLLPFDTLNRMIDRNAQSTQHSADVDVRKIDVQKLQAQATREQESALVKLNDTILGSLNADLGLEQAQLRSKESAGALTEAQKALAEAIRIHGATSQEAKDAQDALAGASIGAREASLSEAAAAQKAAEQHAQLSGSSLGARDSMIVERDELVRMRDTLAPGSALRANLDGYINDLNTRIPREVRTEIVVSLQNRVGGNLSIEERAGGGFVAPGQIYTVGEHGTELLAMGDRGGYVFPHGSTPAVAGGRTINVTVNGANLGPLDEARLVGLLRDHELLYA